MLNAGSATLKFDLVEVEGAASEEVRSVARGLVDGVAGPGRIRVTPPGGPASERPVTVSGYGDAVRQALAALRSHAGASLLIDAVGHRVVHGGELFEAPAVIDDAALARIEALSELAPLHNPPAIEGIRAARNALGNDVPMVAVFDTAFHRSMPDQAARYAVPRELAERHHIRRYGFHGIAHQWMVLRYAYIARRKSSNVAMVTMHLGNGCSAAAVRNGRSVDTSMGFTPLEGLMMGTRSGDVDPAAVAYLALREGVSAETVVGWLNHQSGLLGVSGLSADMRDVERAASQGNRRAVAAIEMFCYRARKYLGAYLAALGGGEAVVFGGGIGEHSPAVREGICRDMEWAGLELDRDKNGSAIGKEARISAPSSRIAVYVIPVDEAALIAREVAARLRSPRERSGRGREREKR